MRQGNDFMTDKTKRDELRRVLVRQQELRMFELYPHRIIELLDDIDEQEAEVARLRKGLKLIARSSVPGTKTDFGRGVAVGAGAAQTILEAKS